MKFNKQDVRQIRKTFKTTDTSLTVLARKHGVAVSCIYNIVQNITYKNPRYQPPKDEKRFDVKFAKDLRVNKQKTFREIADLEAKKYNRSKPYSVTHIRNVMDDNNEK